MITLDEMDRQLILARAGDAGASTAELGQRYSS